MLSWLFKFAKSNLLVIPALCNPKVNAANEIEGSLNIKRTNISKGGGIKRNRNDIDLIVRKPILLLNIKIKMGGKLTAIPVDKRLNNIVSNISFKKSFEIKFEFEVKILLKVLKVLKVFTGIAIL